MLFSWLHLFLVRLANSSWMRKKKNANMFHSLNGWLSYKRFELLQQITHGLAHVQIVHDEHISTWLQFSGNIKKGSIKLPNSVTHTCCSLLAMRWTLWTHSGSRENKMHLYFYFQGCLPWREDMLEYSSHGGNNAKTRFWSMNEISLFKSDLNPKAFIVLIGRKAGNIYTHWVEQVSLK